MGQVLVYGTCFAVGMALSEAAIPLWLTVLIGASVVAVSAFALEK